MTNKQVIDGINVSECNFCEWKSSDIPQCRIRMASFEQTCKGYNCYYKQLARKKQECKELKKELAKVYKDIKLSPLCYKCDEEECLQKEIDKLKTENEMLRDELRFYKDFYYACN